MKKQWRGTERTHYSSEELIPELYTELRKLAAAKLARLATGHTRLGLVGGEGSLCRGISLKKGRNTLVVKVVNGILSWANMVELLNAAGEPLKDVRITLDPGERF